MNLSDLVEAIMSVVYDQPVFISSRTHIVSTSHVVYL